MNLMDYKLTCDFQMNTAVHGQGQGQVVEGVKAHTDCATLFTADLRLELTVK